MNTSIQVDVIVAEGAPMAGLDDLADVLGDPVEAIDVAPDPKRRIIVLASTKAAGQELAESLGIEPVAVVTPRSPHAARGVIADEIVEAPDLTADVIAGLMVNVSSSLATTGGA